MTTWLITGICGFIGRNLVRRLAQEADIRVLGFDNLVAGNQDELATLCDLRPWEPGTAPGPLEPGQVALQIGDITDLDVVKAATAEADVVIHLAADSGVMTSLDDPIGNFQVNAGGTLNLLEAIRSRPATRFVMASTGAALGQQEPPVREDHVPRPLSPYGAGKLAGEAYCQAFAGSYGLHTCALRFSNVYGPYSGQKTSAVAKFIRQLLAGEGITIFGDGNQTRDFIYVEDLCEALLTVARSDQQGEVFHIATGQETTVNQLFAELTKLLEPAGITPDLRYEDARAGEIVRNFASIEKVTRVLGWKPTHSFEDGLAKTVAWFLDQREV